MWFGADYHPEHWVYPYDGTAEEPEARWLTRPFGANPRYKPYPMDHP